MNKNKTILVLGVTGMLGSTMYKFLQTNCLYFNVWGTTRNVSKEDGNILQFSTDDLSELPELCQKIKPDYIINCIGTIPQTKPVKHEYYINNYMLPAKILSSCNESILIQPSTDCIFSGIPYRKPYNLYSQKENREEFHSTDSYGISKRIFDNLGQSKAIILRTSIIGPCSINGKGLFDWVVSNRNKSVLGFTNHYWNGNTTLEISKFVYSLITTNDKDFGVYTLGNEEIVSKAELIRKLSSCFNLNIKVNDFISETSIDRTLEISNKVKPITSQLEELKQWCDEQKIAI